MQFSSKPPFQKKFWDSDRSYYLVDRPQTNPTNRILDITRRWKTRRGYTPRMAVLRMEHWTEQSQQFIESPTFTRDMETHALKVLRKWKAVYGEEN